MGIYACLLSVQPFSKGFPGLCEYELVPNKMFIVGALIKFELICCPEKPSSSISLTCFQLLLNFDFSSRGEYNPLFILFERKGWGLGLKTWILYVFRQSQPSHVSSFTSSRGGISSISSPLGQGNCNRRAYRPISKISGSVLGQEGKQTWAFLAKI